MAKVAHSTKNLVRKRASNSCEKCGSKIVRNKAGFSNGSIHHRMPRRIGGPDTIPNLVLLCNKCHREVHRNEFLASLEGWIAWVDPDVTPCLRAGARARSTHPDPTSRGWALLVPDGTLEFLNHQEGEHLCLYVNIGWEKYLQGA